MYVFYDIRELVMLARLQLINLIVEKGYSIWVSQLRLGDYSGITNQQVKTILEKGLINIEEQESDVFQFVQENLEQFNFAGKSLLALMHYCKTANKILIVDETENVVIQIAEYFEVQTCTLVDFYRETINDEKYLEFILELKKGEIIR